MHFQTWRALFQIGFYQIKMVFRPKLIFISAKFIQMGNEQLFSTQSREKLTKSVKERGFPIHRAGFPQPQMRDYAIQPAEIR